MLSIVKHFGVIEEIIPQAFLAGFLALRGDLDEAASLRTRVLDTAPALNARQITRGFEVVSPELCKRFDEALREAGFDEHPDGG